MSEVTLETLITAVTSTKIYAKLLTLAQAVGLSTESWQDGDPTKTLLDSVSRRDETRESLIVDAIRGGLLDLAEGGWLTLLARYGFKVERRGATFATCTVRYTNAGTAFAEIEEPEDSTTKNSTTEAFFRNTTVGVIPAGGFVDLEVIADVAGSDANSAVGEIDYLVTSIPNVTVSNTTAAIGTDEETDEELRARCRAKMQSISPNGPRGAYHYFATTPEYNEGAAITRTRVVPDSDTGDVQVYLAGAAGAVSSDDRQLAEDAIDAWATPLCIEATVSSATNFSQAVTYTLWVYDDVSLTVAEIEEAVENALLEALRTRPIGGDVIPPAATGAIYKDWLEAVILRAVHPYGFKVTLATPTVDVALTIGQVMTLGAVTATINLVAS